MSTTKQDLHPHGQLEQHTLFQKEEIVKPKAKHKTKSSTNNLPKASYKTFMHAQQTKSKHARNHNKQNQNMHTITTNKNKINTILDCQTPINNIKTKRTQHRSHISQLKQIKLLCMFILLCTCFEL